MYLIGVDGGGTKTTVALADEKGNVMSQEVGGPSNWRNVGISKSAEVVFSLIENVKKEKEVSISFIALAGVEEEWKEKKEEFVEILKEKGLEGDVVLGSDQLAAFRAGTDEKDGVVVICGTGTVARGFRNEKDIKASAWGYLADEGSAFYVGIEGYRVVQKAFDGRGEKTKITDILRREWSVETPEELNKKIYGDFYKNIPLLSIMVGEAGREGDKVAIAILKKSGEEVALSAKTVIKNLGFRERFPVVISGGMFNSEVFLDVFKKEVVHFNPKADIILLRDDPVKGAIKIAIKKINS